ncbi:hypothetical protein D1AOALGA4SA_10472 [Olavius algarvensis Delta 1 endosymbiont]|nr:hypothetical protein D1AOALGA4SA_10472 [Olavius algarvensis Delta 1 endosymbiont]
MENKVERLIVKYCKNSVFVQGFRVQGSKVPKVKKLFLIIEGGARGRNIFCGYQNIDPVLAALIPA